MYNYSLSRELQSSMSLFRAPVSNRAHPPISILNDDVLLHIFYLYRLHCLYIRDEDEETPLRFIRRWDRQPWWYKPAQVSRRWRGIILVSPSLLDLHLVCTYRVHVAEMLAHYPPFPLTIFYNESPHEMTENDEEGALVSLSHRVRVHRISLRMPHHKLEKFTNAMDGQFPTLERLDIDSSIPEDPRLILPQTFDAPNLRHVDLRRIALPMRCPLLTTAKGLVFLRLEDIPRSAYFSPSYLLTRLSFMPQLETLRIGFYYSPLPNHAVVDTPAMTHVTLPNLRVFSFRGFEAYLEGLLSRMSAPDLSTLHVQYFNQLMWSVPHLFPFMKTSANLKFHAVKLTFSDDSFHLESESDPLQGRWKYILDLQIRCRPFDWQVVSAVQILSPLAPVLSVVVEKLELIVNHDQSSGWYDYINRTKWRELFRLFNNVKAIRVETNPELIRRLGHSLRAEDGELPLELLPNLEELSYSQSYVVDAFTPFINERQEVGHPVRLVQNPDGSQSGTWITLRVEIPAPSSSQTFQQRLSCPMPGCNTTFDCRHSQEVKRLKSHLLAFHLPYAFYCPIPPCHWRGGRRDKYDAHFRSRHPEYDKHEPGQIYDYASILWFIFEDGITYKTAERYALDFVAEKAKELGMEEEWKDLCGRRAKGGPCRCDLPMD